VLTQKAYNKGYRITGNTMGLSRGIGARKVHIINEFNVVKKKRATPTDTANPPKSSGSTSDDDKKITTVVFVFDGLIKSTSIDSIIGDKIVMSVNLQMLFIKNNGKFVRNYFLESELDEIKKNINLSIIPIIRNVETFNIDILKMVGINSELLIKKIIFNLMKGKMKDTVITAEQEFELFERTITIQIDK
jgi:hypothetical protein